MTQSTLDFEAPAAVPAVPAALIAQVKQAGEDFEFYPTTEPIIQRLVSDLRSFGETWREDDFRPKYTSVLDVGAGNGKVLLALKDGAKMTELYAIEKSPRLCQELPEEVFIVGTDFKEQSLLSKHVQVIFSNPPFSEYEEWAAKIIREASASLIYLVIPDRWESDGRIQEALKFRDIDPDRIKGLGYFDFSNADRSARCKVQLIRLDLTRRFEHWQSEREKDDAFERFFNEQFKDLIERFKDSTPQKETDDNGRTKKKAFHELVIGPHYPQAMVEIYNLEMAKVQKNYALCAELDTDLLREFEIHPQRIMGCLKARLTGLKSEYWNELFTHLGSITGRLTSKSRQEMLDKLAKHLGVDFTLHNILVLIIWAIKNANRYIENQLIETYEEMVAKANVINYKSNKRVWVDDRWRYDRDREQPTHYALDYRIVCERMGGIDISWSGSEQGLAERAATFIRDILTVANNLGFSTNSQDPRLHCYRGGRAANWEPGGTQNFRYLDPATGASHLLFDVRAFKNGNLHFRFHQKFMLALNVEHGRLKGWLRTPNEAVTELDKTEAADFFKVNHQLSLSGDPARLLTE